MTITAPIYDSSFFAYDEPEKNFIAEASDLPGGLSIGRLFNDACDIGIQIRSSKTGKVEQFYHAVTDCQDGDIRFWAFKSCNPKLAGVEVMIFND